MSECYLHLARHYDEFVGGAGAAKWCDFAERIFRAYGRKPELVLDMACGTGRIALELARRGYDVIGIDVSCEMLSVAAEGAAREGLDIRLVNQDMRRLDLFGTVDAALCCLDGMNYLRGDGDLDRCFGRVFRFLNPGGVFIFDMNTRYKLEKVLPANTFVYESGEAYIVWRSTYNEKRRECSFLLDIFEKEGSFYRRFAERHVQRAYEAEDVIDRLKRAGFGRVRTFGELRLRPPREDEERIFFAAVREDAPEKPKKSPLRSSEATGRREL